MVHALSNTAVFAIVLENMLFMAVSALLLGCNVAARITKNTGDFLNRFSEDPSSIDEDIEEHVEDDEDDDDEDFDDDDEDLDDDCDDDDCDDDEDFFDDEDLDDDCDDDEEDD